MIFGGYCPYCGKDEGWSDPLSDDAITLEKLDKFGADLRRLAAAIGKRRDELTADFFNSFPNTEAD